MTKRIRIAIAFGFALTGSAHAAPEADPSLVELQRAALATARLEPDRIDRWERRMHVAALAPSLRMRVLRGGTDLLSTTDYNGNARLTVGDHNAWQFEVAATWALDRLVWHPDEMRLAREAHRMAAHREKLVVEIASLDAERRRLARRIENAGGTAGEVEELALRRAEVEAVLDGLTGGMLSRVQSRLPEKAAPVDSKEAPKDAGRASGGNEDESGDGDDSNAN